MSKRGYTTAEAADYLGVSDRAVRALRSNGDLPVRYFGNKPLFDKGDLDKYFDALPAERSTNERLPGTQSPR